MLAIFENGSRVTLEVSSHGVEEANERAKAKVEEIYGLLAEDAFITVKPIL